MGYGDLSHTEVIISHEAKLSMSYEYVVNICNVMLGVVKS